MRVSGIAIGLEAVFVWDTAFIFEPGSVLEKSLAEGEREKNLAARIAAEAYAENNRRSAGVTLGDQKHLFTLCDGKWCVQKVISDQGKHEEQVVRVRPIYRCLGYDIGGQARQAFYFGSPQSINYDPEKIRLALLALSAKGKLPAWAGPTSPRLMRICQYFPAFTDPAKFAAFLRMDFSPYGSVDGSAALGILDFINNNFLKGYKEGDSDYLVLGMTGLSQAHAALYGYGEGSMEDIVQKLSGVEPLDIAVIYPAELLSIAIRVALLDISIIAKQDSRVGNDAARFNMLGDAACTHTGLEMLAVYKENFGINLSEARLGSWAQCNNYLRRDQDDRKLAELYNAGAKKLKLSTDVVLVSEKKQKLSAEDSSDQLFKETVICPKDLLHRYGGTSYRTKDCTSPKCFLSHFSRKHTDSSMAEVIADVKLLGSPLLLQRFMEVTATQEGNRV
jgi:hypothetical protein